MLEYAFIPIFDSSPALAMKYPNFNHLIEEKNKYTQQRYSMP